MEEWQDGHSSYRTNSRTIHINIYLKKKNFEDITMVLAIFHMERVPKNERGKKP